MELKELITQKLQENFPDSFISSNVYMGDLSVEVDKKDIVKICTLLKENSELEFILCEDVTAIDWSKRKDRFTVVYHIFSFKHNFRLRIKANVDESDCTIDTVSSVWNTANWEEREVYDMFGISFNNHPDLRRMYMPEDFEHYPLRKDFPLTGIPGSLSLPKK
ncbi:MAG TPA: NADH-quinone oxidoreductase subunit C [Ignavibacteria bacterium]|nr:NADH-quinone oxidoreductase subunit C [Ignavibacteria bacterium]